MLSKKYVENHPLPFSFLMPKPKNIVSVPQTPLARAVERYLVYLRSEENKSPLTVEAYRRSLGLFLKIGEVSDPQEVSKVSVRMYKANLHTYRTRDKRELAVRTKNHHLTVLRVFLRWD